jgi:SpoVK/Ycf46/Vps4 family AAA+-type ATPase
MQAHYAYDSDIERAISLKEIFRDKKYITISLDHITLYEHRKMQVVLEKYLASINAVIIENELNKNFAEENKFDIQISPSETKAIYNKAFLIIVMDSRKLCFEIEKDSHRSIYFYKLYCEDADSQFLQNLKAYANKNNIFRYQKLNCNAEFLKLDNISWDDVILEDEVKDVIKANIEEMFDLCTDLKKHGISVKRGIILHGEPGTGKTKICKCLAKDTKYSVLYVLPSDIRTPNSISYICEMAQDLAPCLLIIEDIDWIAQDRAGGMAPFVMELMNKIDGLETFGDIITLGTTNALSDLENAVKNRPGRFDRLINIGLPSFKSIKKMLLRFTKNHIINNDIDIDKIARACERLSGAHVFDLCNTTAVYAVKDKSYEGEKLLLKNEHFLKSINEIKNKNYSSYLEMQSKGSSFGFSNNGSSFGLQGFGVDLD